MIIDGYVANQCPHSPQGMSSQDNTERKNRVTLTYKVESLAELKFDPGLRVIGEYLSEIDWILRIN